MGVEKPSNERDASLHHTCTVYQARLAVARQLGSSPTTDVPASMEGLRCFRIFAQKRVGLIDKSRIFAMPEVLTNGQFFSTAEDMLTARALGDYMAQIKKIDPDKTFRRVMSASSLSGDRVKNPANEDLGKIKDVMIDVGTGRVAYAVLSFGGVLGVGDKLFAVPWDALMLDEDEKQFILNADKETLESAPGFDKDNWPDMADQNWSTQVYQHYGVEPYWEAETKTRHGGGGL